MSKIRENANKWGKLVIIGTKHFGFVEIFDKKILKFPLGIYGFRDRHDFVLLSQGDSDLFIWMQSIQQSDLCFVLINPFEVMNDYQPVITDKAKKVIGLEQDDKLELLCVVTVPKHNPAKMTINLKCPIVVNARNNVAHQEILESDKYALRHPMMENIKRKWKLIPLC